ncbi:MAG: hypothetical protein K0S71_133 [Clostridia bacterium]|jgi:hypothetical protein|nr:hypothetical protein [Clostridia bacterium]
MNHIIRFKSLVALILSIGIVFADIPLRAAAPSVPPTPTPVSSSEHKEIIREFIYEITEIQSQVFNIAQLVLNNQPLSQGGLLPNITRINNNIDRLNRRIEEYSENIPSISTQNRDVLLISNALNFIKNGLLTLSVLAAADTDVERITLLDEYFRSRIAAKDTLKTVEDLIQ